MISAILTYHSIDDSGSVISMSEIDFERQLASLAESGIPIVPLNEVQGRPGSVALTFDDGFRNFRVLALPLLERYRFPATVFVVSGYCGRDNNWPGQGAVPALPLMDWDELVEIAARGVEVGGHSVHHPDLSKISPHDAAREMAQCNSQIEEHVGKAVLSFAYPYGRMPQQVRPDCEVACGTRLSFVQPWNNPLYLPRLDAYYLRGGPQVGSILSPVSRTYFGARGILRSLREHLSPSS
jgi:peptidoglycan/xylan/chitin deacetylase (PgdA/CDA1 family)